FVPRLDVGPIGCTANPCLSLRNHGRPHSAARSAQTLLTGSYARYKIVSKESRHIVLASGKSSPSPLSTLTAKGERGVHHLVYLTVRDLDLDYTVVVAAGIRSDSVSPAIPLMWRGGGGKTLVQLNNRSDPFALLLSSGMSHEGATPVPLAFQALMAEAKQRHAQLLHTAIAERDAENQEKLKAYSATLQQKYSIASKEQEDMYKQDLARREAEYNIELEQRAAADRARNAEFEAMRLQHEEIMARLNVMAQQNPAQSSNTPPSTSFTSSSTSSSHQGSASGAPHSTRSRFSGSQPQTGPGPTHTEHTSVIEKQGIMAFPDVIEMESFYRRFHTAEDANSARKGSDLIAQDLVQVTRKLSAPSMASLTGLQILGKPSTQSGTLLNNTSSLTPPRGNNCWQLQPHRISKSFVSSRLGNLNKLYKHYIFHVEGSRMLSNERQPGRLVAKEKRSAKYQDRYRLSRRRTKTGEDNNHSERLLRLARSRRAHSKTCKNPATGDRERCAMPQRSEAATAYFEHLDSLARNDNVPPPQRVKVADPPAGECKLLPCNTSLDFFDPDFYNALPITTRQRLNANWVALPGDVPYDPSNPALKLPYNDFIMACGNGLSANYIEESADPISGEFSGYDAELQEDMES
ncbi:hypothetical protein BKA62DRAFT_679475, partial [Auriculariales sp. MPI-PUGE-AT-0066]